MFSQVTVTIIGLYLVLTVCQALGDLPTGSRSHTTPVGTGRGGRESHFTDAETEKHREGRGWPEATQPQVEVELRPQLDSHCPEGSGPWPKVGQAAAWLAGGLGTAGVSTGSRVPACLFCHPRKPPSTSNRPGPRSAQLRDDRPGVPGLLPAGRRGRPVDPGGGLLGWLSCRGTPGTPGKPATSQGPSLGHTPVRVLFRVPAAPPAPAPASGPAAL